VLDGGSPRFSAGYGKPPADARPKMRISVLGCKPAENARGLRSLAAVLTLGAALALAGCSGVGLSEDFQRGYVLQEGALEQIPIGATQEQVLIVLGTPSTVATVNGDAFYYISQKTHRGAAFMPQHVVDQRVIAVYFNKDRRVTRLANYGIKDGKVFDFISRTTPTGGAELSLLGNMFTNLNPFGMLQN
jgi:outer membrane protein assembly factor BamE (lipoprotein component of BamABCDE complex)